MNLMHQDSEAENSSTLPDRRTEASDAPRLNHGVVRSVHMGLFFVICADTVFYARAAASCLLLPRPGDQVLISSIGTQNHILAVLERADSDRATVQLDGDVTLRLPKGSLKIEASRGVSLDAGPSLELQAGNAALDTQRLSIRSGDIMTQARHLFSHAERRLDVTQYRHDIARHVRAEYGDSVRRVSGHDEQSARSSRIVVERDWRVRAERSDILARKRVKIDAAQVDLG